MKRVLSLLLVLVMLVAMVACGGGAKESTAFLEIIDANIQTTLPKNHFRAHRDAEPLFSADHPIWSRPYRA